ncbi:helix-turn-helix transcriptional regulator [Mucilaginibacter ginsenosidivorax]|uniref:Helix-turn-helix transcriptional regulator n=1 Tax=Mucilaginibacter ginsenosidivorax TaxID=862126 RepID=A0A5B8W7Q0_9SPHI|nr:AraC family transcriptional regulator [Mucilaginibacter ginsenosidivorax]QEC78985.1 helix-turn-helix transcriptional regulator [Mucilaginibacter ginsenosidivorax]
MIRITSALSDDYVYQFNTHTREKAVFNQTGSWGSIRIVTIELANIRFFVVDFEGNKTYPVTVEVDTQCLMMVFTLSGQSQPGLGRLPFCEAEHCCFFSPGHLKFKAALQGNLLLFVVCFVGDSLKKSMPLPMNPGQLNLLQTSRPTTLQMSQVIRGIMRNIDKKGNHHIYFEAKALELLFLKLEQVAALAGQPAKSFLKIHDLDRIYQAKSIVEENLLNPCSLIELAHKVGLNDFKLKKGFREVLGTTVFGYLYDLRMDKAKLLLKDGKPVREVAFEVGYKNAHHFTAAFKKKFGYLPSKINKLLSLFVFLLSLID